MDDDAGMVHPGRHAAWWTRPPVLFLTAVGTLVVILAVLFLADMAQQQDPQEAAAAPAPTSTPESATAGPASSSSAADPTSMTTPDLSTSSPPAATTTTVSTASSSAATTTRVIRTTPTSTSAVSTTMSSTTMTTSRSSSTAPPPRSASLTAPTWARSAFTARAGSTLDATFTVSNTGAGNSGPRTVTVVAPAGVTIVGVVIALGPARSGLRGPGAALAPGAGPATRAVSASIDCLGTTCTYTVPAHMRITVTLTLDVAPTAMSGVLQLSASGFGPSRATLTVQPAATATATSPPVTDTTTASPDAESASPAEQAAGDESGVPTAIG